MCAGGLQYNVPPQLIIYYKFYNMSTFQVTTLKCIIIMCQLIESTEQVGCYANYNNNVIGKSKNLAMILGDVCKYINFAHTHNS